MIDRKGEFKKWLIQEIRTKSNASYREIIDYVSDPNNQSKFDGYYKRWSKSITHNNHYNGPRSMKEILERNK